MLAETARQWGHQQQESDAVEGIDMTSNSRVPIVQRVRHTGSRATLVAPKAANVAAAATVTVVIPCYNYGRYLPAAVASVTAQKGFPSTSLSSTMRQPTPALTSQPPLSRMIREFGSSRTNATEATSRPTTTD